MGISKVVLGSEVKLDLTADTVEAGKLLSGTTAHGKDGEPITGTCDYDVNSQDATASAAEILNGKTVYARGTKITGTMPNNEAAIGNIITKTEVYSIPQGYHDGSGKVTISPTEQDKLIPGNIKSGVTILGIEGSYGGESISAQSKTVTPSFSVQNIQPDTGYDYLSGVTVEAIPYTEIENSAGGITLTIG